ncbi:MAG: metal-sulfur cluster biosynthetic enzyme [Candidatus Cloacimonadota bacterium]|nr:MAG: metal-sulfur cluster biosynthetic enzyme [Candidatus Cloacimonadota bacterium]
MDFNKKAIEIIEGVEHPAINHSLYNLGIIKSYEVNDNNVNIIIALPALNIPIIDMLVQSIKQPLAAINAQVNIEKVVMNQEEMQKFLAMEQSAWKGM